MMTVTRLLLGLLPVMVYRVSAVVDLTNAAVNVCPTFGGGLYVITDQLLQSEASAACLSVGLGVANLTFSNNYVASQLLVQCGAGLAWISSFERVRSNTCPLMTGDGNVFFASGAACVSQRHPVICQDFAATLTDTATSTFTTCTTSTETDTVTNVSTITSTIVSTIVSTGCHKKGCAGCGGGGCGGKTKSVMLPGGVVTVTKMSSVVSTVTLVEKAGFVVKQTVVPTTVISVQQQPPRPLVIEENDDPKEKSKQVVTDCPMSVPACQADGEFVVLRTYLSQGRGDCSCRKLGMRLANINTNNLNRAQAALSKCSGGGQYEMSAWISSWQGDHYGSTCLALSSSGAINAQSSCHDGLPVLCQRDPFPAADSFLQADMFLQYQDPVYSLCSTTQNNLFIVYSQDYLANQDPAAACGSFGMLPANVFDNTRAAAAAVFSVCSAGDASAVAAQVNAFDGLQGGACNLIDDTQAVLIVDNNNGAVAQNCFVNQKYFLCQGQQGSPSPSISTVYTGPYFFVTTTTVKTGSVRTVTRSSTLTVSTSTTVRTTEIELISLSLTTLTSTTTTTIKITSQIPTTTTATTSQDAPSTVTVTVTSCPPTPPARCALMGKRTGLVLLQDQLPFDQAECACRQHGLRLATLKVDTFAEAAELQFDCLGAFQKAWISGPSEADGAPMRPGECKALYVGGEKTGNAAAALPLYCQVKAAVLCQQPI